jgi:predicted acylesterase/phospholipase RssA
VAIASVDVGSGEYVVFDEKEARDDLIDAVIASSSIPFVFPPRQTHDRTMMDGGTAWNFNLESAIDRCLELVDDESQIIIDTILCGQAQLNATHDTSNAMSNFLRARSIASFYSTANGVIEIEKAHPKVNLRYLVVPS